MGFWDSTGFDPSQPQTITAPWTFTNGSAVVAINTSGLTVANGLLSAQGSGIAYLDGDNGVIFQNGSGQAGTLGSDVLEFTDTVADVTLAISNIDAVGERGIIVSDDLAGVSLRVAIPTPAADNTVTFPDATGTVQVAP